MDFTFIILPSTPRMRHSSYVRTFSSTPKDYLHRRPSAGSLPRTPQHSSVPFPETRNTNFAAFPIPQTHRQPPSHPHTPTSSRPPSTDSRRGFYQTLQYQLSPDLANDLSKFPFLDWIVWRAPAHARKWVGQTRQGHITLNDPAVYPTVRELRINSTMAENPLRHAIQRWGYITVAAARNQPYVTVGDVLNEIYSYFRTPLTQREAATMTPEWHDLVNGVCAQRTASQSADDVFPLHDPFVPGLRRCDVLLHDIRYAGLEIDPNFHTSRQLFLSLEDDRLRNSS
ncbi:hypothetical protein NLJ89_g6496 [Agrocybe chaxingu]|uniref:DUF6699 domain-containing protein n=1 Tax=Agrocybe chaxingu TaxID=84603 RepID=A0A9W8JZ17_9AGAR|nr:hypothetical protein NLJ89_g6496 [Agrocybe chaxingu]